MEDELQGIEGSEHGTKLPGGNKMKKQIRWDIFWAIVAVSIMLFLMGWSISKAINSIDLTISNIYTFDGQDYKCWHYQNGDMECASINDPDVGFGRAP